MYVVRKNNVFAIASSMAEALVYLSIPGLFVYGNMKTSRPIISLKTALSSMA